MNCIRTITDGTVCGQPVSDGGNVHAIGHCRSARKSARKKRKKKAYTDTAMEQRGVAVNLNKGKEKGKKG